MKKRTGEILELLDEKYGTEFICYLNYETPWQLLIATMLSAQCTDARVNIVTKDLFRKVPVCRSICGRRPERIRTGYQTNGILS